MDSISGSKQVAPPAYGRRQIITDVAALITAALFDVGVATASTGSEIDPLGFIIWGVALGSLMWRRHRPITVLVITAVGAISFIVIGYRGANVFPFVFATYSVAMYSGTKLRARVAALASTLAVLGVFSLATTIRGEFEIGDLVRNGLLLGGRSWLETRFGRATRELAETTEGHNVRLRGGAVMLGM